MESTLAIDKFMLESEAGDSAGFGPGKRFGGREWDADQTRLIDRSVNSGLRNVYFTTEIVDARGKVVVPSAYDWTWFQPTSTIVLPEGEQTIPTPADYGGLNGRIIPASSDGSMQFPVAVVGREALFGMRNTSPDSTGRPSMIYVETLKSMQPGRSNRYQFQVYPIPDADYTLQVWYYTTPNAPTEMLPFVYGGATHAETFKAAVRAAYERYCLNIKDGPEWATFEERLIASVAADRRFKPVTIGPNIDRSDWNEFDYNPHYQRDFVPLTVNGVPSGYP